MSISTFPYELARRAATVLGSKIYTSITVRQHGLTVPDRPPVTDTSRPDDHRVHDER